MSRWWLTMALVMCAAACGPIDDDGEGENGPPAGTTEVKDCSEFCEGDSRDPALCKSCQQGPIDGFSPDPLPWRPGGAPVQPRP